MLALVLLLAVGAGRASAEDFYWETPRPLAGGTGRFPTLLQLGDGMVAVWQESESSGSDAAGESGNAWLSLARFRDGSWEIRRRFAGPFPFRGSEPNLYSAASEGDNVAIAAASGDGQIEVLVSKDGAGTFAVADRPVPGAAAVAPRIFIAARGGYILFVTQGQADTLSLAYAASADGLQWKPFRPLIAAEEGMSLSFLPAAGHSQTKDGARDVVVFQSLLTTSSRPTYQLYQKYSTDGGQTWTRAKRVTTIAEPAGKGTGGPDSYDNERPSLGTVAGRLWLTWERKALGSQSQVYAGPLDEALGLSLSETDIVSSGQGSCAAPQILDLAGDPAVVWFDNRRGGNRIYLAIRSGLDWAESDLSGGRADNSFGKLAVAGGKAYALWQASEGGRERVMVLEPDTTVARPSLAPLDFAQGRRTRQELATVRVDLPADSSGIEGYSWLWSRDPEAAPPKTVTLPPSRKTLQERADADGAWYLSVIARDFAGNWSEPARLRFDRDRTPPPPPDIAPGAVDAAGFLASNSFTMDWSLPAYPDGSVADDVAGYTWSLRYLGPVGKTPPADQKGLTPPPAILGSAPSVSWRNVDDGYYVFTVAAIDETGNISAPTSVLLGADKYIPYTTVTFADSSRDDFGRTSIRLVGRGYTAEGRIERVVLDRDGREPYDLDKTLAAGDFSILSDREIRGPAFEDLPAATYRIGLYHPKRGWYWTGPVLAIDVSGTLKFGQPPAPYKPSWALLRPHGYRYSIYDAFSLFAVLFAGLGILLAGRQTLAAIRDGEKIRLEVLALISGGPMPTEAKELKKRTLRKRGAGLRVKVTLTITILVIFVVLLVSVPLGLFMTQSESSTLASGLQQRAYVLLESVAQGGRSYLPSQDILQLGFLPQQSLAMDDSVYITVTGYAAESSTDADVVWATNDPGILRKIDTPTFQPGVSRLKDELSPQVGAMLAQVNAAALAEVGDISKALAALSQEGQGLATKLDAASKRRLADIGTTSRSYEKEISDKLFTLSNASVGSIPSFDPTLAATRTGNYLFFKPILFRKGGDQLYYRGLVRLEVSTGKIVANVVSERQKLVQRALLIAAIALALGFGGAFLLSSVIVIPIRRLVKHIEMIRDEEDKEKLEGLAIQVRTRDEIYTLADTVNQMSEGLAKAAKASKELIVGKGIQKMFIPLDPGPGGKGKLNTGHHEDKDYECYGYYEGAKGVSGDYWDFEEINSRYHYFIKCDISGKGVSAALIMVQVATMVINYFNAWKKVMPKTIDLTDLTYKINDFIEERHFVGRFAAFTLGVWDSKEGVAYICEAGDRKLHTWNARRGELVEELLPDSPAAGPFPSFMVQGRNPFVQVVRKFEKDDVLFLYTDGIEEAQRHFRDSDFKVITCTAVEKDQVHENHSGGQDNEEFGYDRLTAILKALGERGSYRLEKKHNPVKNDTLTFDFSTCVGSLEEKVLALIAVEKVFRMYPDPAAGPKDVVLVDEKVDAFLEAHFDQYRLYCSNKSPHTDPQNENPGYFQYAGMKEDGQYDDLTILGIRRK
jgi:hypothetical protein